MTLGDKLKLLRTKKGMTQEALAEKLNVSRSAIAKWESNNGIPEISNLKQISQVLNVSLDELLDNKICIGESEHKEENSRLLPGRCFQTRQLSSSDQSRSCWFLHLLLHRPVIRGIEMFPC